MARPTALRRGIGPNRAQFLHQLLQVLLVGLTLGMMRTVVPALAESEFGVPKSSFMLLTAFVVAFGVVKGGMNVVAGRLSERIGQTGTAAGMGCGAADPADGMARAELGLDSCRYCAARCQPGTAGR